MPKLSSTALAFLQQRVVLGAVVIVLFLGARASAKVFVAHNVNFQPSLLNDDGAAPKLIFECDQGGAIGRLSVQHAKIPSAGRTDASKPGTRDAGSSRLGITVELQAQDGCGFNIDSLEFAVPHELDYDGRYLVYSVADNLARCELISPVFKKDRLEGSDNGDRLCRLVTNGDYQGVHRVEFRIVPIGDTPQEGLTFEEIAVNGFVTKAPAPSSAIVWLSLLAVAFMAIYSFLFLLWSTSVRSLVVTDQPSGSSLFSDSTHGSSFYRTAEWSEETRRAIVCAIKAKMRRR